MGLDVSRFSASFPESRKQGPRELDSEYRPERETLSTVTEGLMSEGTQGSQVPAWGPFSSNEISRQKELVIKECGLGGPLL